MNPLLDELLGELEVTAGDAGLALRSVAARHALTDEQRGELFLSLLNHDIKTSLVR